MNKPACDVPVLDLGALDDIMAPPVRSRWGLPPPNPRSRWGLLPPNPRASNYTRSLFHLASAIFALGLLRFLPSRSWLVAVSAGVALSAWTMEVARRRSAWVNERLMAVFAPVAHPHERHGVNSATWYVTALLLISLFAPMRAAEVGIVVLGLADPAAGLIGRRFGRTRIRANRSLEGTLGFVAVGAAAAAGWLHVAYAVPLPALAVLAGVSGVVGALVELVSTRLDDNFTIPVAVTAAVSLAQVLVGG